MTKQAIVVGGGPVGCVLSVLLARHGWEVEVYERRPDLRQMEGAAGRSINLVLTARGLRALEILGLKDQVLEITVPVYGRMMHAHDGELAYQPYGKDDRECNYSVSRGDLNRYLLDIAEREGVTVHFGHAVSEVDVHAGSFLATGPNGARRVETPHLFGADGAPSAVRSGMSAVEGFQESLDLLPDGYKELLFPATAEGNYCMEVRALHIWPQGRHFLMGLPNQGGSFTGTLYLPMEGDESFEQLTTPEAVQSFFAEHYPSALPLLGDFVEPFLDSPTGILGTVRCYPWHVGEQTLLVGDAAHGIVPFFGQGLNSGFEDCAVLHRVLESEQPLPEAFASFCAERKPNTEAIADMALENYIEMRDKVADPAFRLRKAVESRLEKAYPQRFRSRYAMVVYSSIPYAEAQAAGRLQDEILDELCQGLERPEDADLERGRELIEAKLAPYYAERGITLDF